MEREKNRNIINYVTVSFTSSLIDVCLCYSMFGDSSRKVASCVHVQIWLKHQE